MSAGSIPIKKLMNGTDPLADWLIKFGAAEMVIAYSPDSRFYNDLEKLVPDKFHGTKCYPIQISNSGEPIQSLSKRVLYDHSCRAANKYYKDSGIKQRILREIETPHISFQKRHSKPFWNKVN